MEAHVGPVLILEDDDDSRAVLTAILTVNDYAVVAASNGADGLILARQYRPCLILLDLMMPVMDGTEFRQAQLNDPLINAIPVMLISASHDADRAARRLGALCCIRKPIDFEQLMQQVARYCSAVPGHRWRPDEHAV
jgi:CheY-like chemotaxis protein